MSLLQKLGIQAVILIIGFIPIWIMLTVFAVAKPEGFWETFAVLGIFAWFLGGFQVFLIWLMIVFSLSLWTYE